MISDSLKVTTNAKKKEELESPVVQGGFVFLEGYSKDIEIQYHLGQEITGEFYEAVIQAHPIKAMLNLVRLRQELKLDLKTDSSSVAIQFKNLLQSLSILTNKKIWQQLFEDGFFSLALSELQSEELLETNSCGYQIIHHYLIIIKNLLSQELIRNQIDSILREKLVEILEPYVALFETSWDIIKLQRHVHK